MGLMGYYIRDNKKVIFENRISALERLMKQYGENYPYYPIWKAELIKAREKLEKVRG
jgi:uncharacterized protein YutD